MFESNWNDDDDVSFFSSEGSSGERQWYESKQAAAANLIGNFPVQKSMRNNREYTS